MDYDSAEGFDDESVMLGLTEERCRDFSDPESESEDPARERSAMVGDVFISASSDVQRYHTSPTILPSRIATQLRAPTTSP